MRAPICQAVWPSPSKSHNCLKRQGTQPFTDGKTEAQKEKVCCPRSNSLQAAEPRLKLRSICLKAPVPETLREGPALSNRFPPPLGHLLLQARGEETDVKMLCKL